MPIVTIAYQNRGSERKQAVVQSGGCFGFMAGTGFFHGEYEDTKYLAYHLESRVQAERCRMVFEDNALFPYHKFMDVADWNNFLSDNNFRDQRNGSASTHGYVVIEMQPEGYETVGIPQDMFISGLFTARQLAYNEFDKWIDALEEGQHAMLAYVMAEMFQPGNMDESLVFRIGRQSSSNIDTTKFGARNLLNMVQYLNGEDAVGYWGHEGGIIQRGRYKRDSQFSQHGDSMVTVWGRDSTLNMNSLIAPIDNDIPMIHAGFFSPLYACHIINSHVGRQLFDSKLVKSGNQNVGWRVIEKGNDLYKFYAETRPRYKKKYKVGQLVELRADAAGAITFQGNRLINPVSRSFTHNYEGRGFEISGVMPNKTKIEAIDESRGVECIKLEHGTWVSPRMIKLVGVNVADAMPQPINDDIIQNELYTVGTGRTQKVAIARVWDAFDGTVRAAFMDGEGFVQEGSYRRSQLTRLYE